MFSPTPPPGEARPGGGASGRRVGARHAGRSRRVGRTAGVGGEMGAIRGCRGVDTAAGGEHCGARDPRCVGERRYGGGGGWHGPIEVFARMPRRAEERLESMAAPCTRKLHASASARGVDALCASTPRYQGTHAHKGCVPVDTPRSGQATHKAEPREGELLEGGERNAADDREESEVRDGVVDGAEHHRRQRRRHDRL